jgi:hypothetical protein
MENTSKAISDIYRKEALMFKVQQEKKHVDFIKSLNKEREQQLQKRLQRQKELEERFQSEIFD